MLAPTLHPTTVPAPRPESRWLKRCLELRQKGWVALVLLAVAPVFFVLLEAAHASLNVAYWDEFDTALAFVLRLQEGVTPAAALQEFFAVNNEHRMLTSRLVIATMFWLTGTIDFSILSLVGNASIVLFCALLINNAGTLARRLRLGVLLGFLLFHLEHYENFLWSGSSIDHFQVVLVAGAAIVALARGSRVALLGAGLLGVLATLTLAHGIVVWPVGALLLGTARRWRDLAGWLTLAALTVGSFLLDFRPNASHQFAALTITGGADMVHYWLRLLGTPLALGLDAVAPWLGVILLAALVWLGSLGFWHREKVAFWVALYALGALALIAIGRTAQSGGIVHSRYLVLGALAWAMTGFMLLEQWTRPRRPFGALLRILPVLVVFNISANWLFGEKADAWIEGRDRAVARFKQLGTDGYGPYFLYPMPERSTRLLKEAEDRGMYRMPPICLPRSFPDARPSTRIVYYVDEMTVSSRSAFVGGWAGIPGVRSERGTVHVVLRSETETHVFTTVTASRPDVAAAEKSDHWLLSGFRFARRRDRLPTGEFQLGFLINGEQGPEYVMTAHRLILVGEGKALLATGS